MLPGLPLGAPTIDMQILPSHLRTGITRQKTQSPLISPGSATAPFRISPFQLSSKSENGIVTSALTYSGDSELALIPCFPDSFTIQGTSDLNTAFAPQYTLLSGGQILFVCDSGGENDVTFRGPH